MITMMPVGAKKKRPGGNYMIAVAVKFKAISDNATIPDNALLNEDGSPILNDDGSYILTDD